MIDTCYLKVGDSAEVITLLLKNENPLSDIKIQNISLNKLLSKTLPELSKLNEEEKKLSIKRIWETLPENLQILMKR